jgi:hypothetical protein
MGRTGCVIACLFCVERSVYFPGLRMTCATHLPMARAAGPDLGCNSIYITSAGNVYRFHSEKVQLAAM